MLNERYTCPQCGNIASKKKIIGNNYGCLNKDCPLSWKLVVHGDVATSGQVNKLYGWVLEPGTLLKSKYKLVKMLGKGGFGATYLAEDQSMFNQQRAIKEIPRAFCDEKEDEFLTLLNHPAIPKLYERFNLGKFHYSVMEYVEGPSLEEIVKKKTSRLPEPQILYYVKQLSDVLHYIHSQKVVHRDLKPDNILVQRDGAIALIDFGIAKQQHLHGGGTRHLARAASHFFSAPEQYQAGKGLTDFKSDIYSFGAILYFLATGVEPTDALSRDVHKDIQPLPRTINPVLSAKLEQTIVTAMKMDKISRFKDIKAMQTFLFRNGHTTSKIQCPKCKSFMDAHFKFCPNCGNATHPLKESLPRPFIFRSGQQAQSLKQFYHICNANWEDAREKFYNGEIEKWLNTFAEGRKIFSKAVAIRQRQKDRDLGLKEFLLSIDLNKTTSSQKLKISLPKGKKVSFRLKLNSQSLIPKIKYPVIPLVDWIQVRPHKVKKADSDCGIKLWINSKKLKIGDHRGTIIIGDDATRPVHHIDVSLAVLKQQQLKSYVLLSSIFFFTSLAFLIRHIGPNAKLALSQVSIIMLTSLVMGAINSHFGKNGLLLGLIMGGCLGAMMNIISYFVYPWIDKVIIASFIAMFTLPNSPLINCASWGALGVYTGGMFGFCLRKL
jgi:serine/threonine protein kinase